MMVDNKSNTRKKSAVKKKTGKAYAKKKVLVLDNDALLLVKPINKGHAGTITALKKAMVLSERTEKALAAAQGKVATAKDKLAKARANAKAKKSDAAKSSAMRAGEALSKASEALGEKQQATKAVAIVLKEAANEVRAGIGKEEARQKALMAFSEKWEKEYDRNVIAKAKGKGKGKAKAKAKKPSAKKTVKKSA